MSQRGALIIVLVSLLFLFPGAAQAERFTNLEYGFSVEYPGELSISVLPGEVLGIDNPIATFSAPGVMGMTVGVSESHGLSAEDAALKSEGVYKENTDRFEILSSSKREIDGKEALVKEYLIESEDAALKIKDVYMKGDDLLYRISGRADESDYRKADIIYLENFFKKFKIIPVNDAMEECIKGFPKRTADEIWSSAAFGDLNQDGFPEIVTGSNEGNLHVWTKDGSEVDGFPAEARDRIRSSPALGDLNGDGTLEIVAGSDDRMLYAWSMNGSILPGFPRRTADRIASSAALGDLDGDGTLEIVMGSNDGGIYAFHNDGSTVCGYPVITGSKVWSSPALSDLDGDGDLDIVIGSERVAEDIISQLLALEGADTGVVNALDGRGYPLAGFPRDLASPGPTDTTGSGIGYSSPILGDLNHDGEIEVIMGATDGLYVLSSNGKDLPGFPRKTGGSLRDSFLAVGDLDGDESLEIVGGATDGRLYAWKSDGSMLPGFPIQTGDYVKHVTLGDIDGDGRQEILGGSSDNRVHAWRLDGSEAKGFPKVTMDNIETSPTLGDLEGDGSLELVVGSDDGGVYVWRISDKYGRLDWPMVRQNAKHTGTFVRST